MKIKITSILLIFLSGYIESQTDVNISRLTVNDGLSQGLILDMIQSKDGFIWIATKDGLNRYDGTQFKVFSVDPFDPFAIRAGDVHCIFEDTHGWIWVAHTEGVDILDPVRSCFFHLNFEKKITDVHSIAESDNGNIWLAQPTEILSVKLNKEVLDQARNSKISNINLPFSAIPLNHVKDGSQGELLVERLYYSHSKSLLLATNQGLFKMDPATNIITPEFSEVGFAIDWIVENKRGDRLMQMKNETESKWVRMSNGDITYSNNKIPHAGFYGLDDNGYAWLVINNNVEKWKPSEFMNGGKPELTVSLIQTGLDRNNGFGYTSLMIDKSGIAWLGTAGFGIIKINENSQKFKTLLPGTSHRGLREDLSGGIYTIDYTHNNYVKNLDEGLQNTELPINATQIMAYDKEGNLWWVSDKLNRRDAKSRIITSYPFMDVLSLIIDREGRPIGVSENGLYRFDPVTKKKQEFLFDHPLKQMAEFSYFLYKDLNEVIWIYSLEGLISATPAESGYQYKFYLNDPKDINSLSTNTVLSVQDDPIEPNTFLWVGTKGGGLNRLNKSTGIFKKYSRQQGLPDNVIYGILAEDKPTDNTHHGYIWLSTNHGLCRFDVAAETSKNFTIADGLQSNEFNAPGYLKTSDGRFIFAGVNGINMFYPDQLRFNEHLPQIQIVGVKVNNKVTDVQGKVPLVLVHDQNLLNFEFAALEFTNPSQNQYRYQLVGVDKDWVDLGNKNNVQFANLAPGDYTFRVLGSNNDGLWSKDFAELKFRINSPWWATWWSYCIYFLMLASAIYSIIYFFKKRLLLRHQFKQKYDEANRLKELDTFKSQLFTNLTHEFRTPLTVILGMTNQLEAGKWQSVVNAKEKGKISNALRLIRNNGKNLLHLINQLLDLSKLENNSFKLNLTQGDIVPYLRYVTESFQTYAQDNNLTLHFATSFDSLLMDFDPEQIKQILTNLISNALKFTPAGGNVIITLSKTLGKLTIEVKDSGIGISTKDLPHIFDRFYQVDSTATRIAQGTGIGLAHAQELVKIMGGSISVKSEIGVGTSIQVSLPVTNNEIVMRSQDTSPLFMPPVSEMGLSQNTMNIDPFSVDADSLDSSLPQLLIIEDNPDVVVYLKSCLEGSYKILVAYNGRIGIEKALEHIPDFIISDVMMPEKDGYQVCDALKNDELTSHIPIILLTAKADAASRMSGLRRGADAYIAKPFDEEELLLQITVLLKNRRRMAAHFSNAVLSKVALPLIDPNLPEDIRIENAFVLKVNSIIEAHYTNENFALPELCNHIAISQSQLYRKMKAVTGKSPSDFIRSYRLNKAKLLLERGDISVSEATYQSGFKDPSYFSKLFQEEFGVQPSSLEGV